MTELICQFCKHNRNNIVNGVCQSNSFGKICGCTKYGHIEQKSLSDYGIRFGVKHE